MMRKFLALGLCLALGLGIAGCDDMRPVGDKNVETMEAVEKGERKQGFVACRVYDIDESQLDDLMKDIQNHGLRVVSFSRYQSRVYLLIEKDVNK